MEAAHDLADGLLRTVRSPGVQPLERKMVRGLVAVPEHSHPDVAGLGDLVHDAGVRTLVLVPVSGRLKIVSSMVAELIARAVQAGEPGAVVRNRHRHVPRIRLRVVVAPVVRVEVVLDRASHRRPGGRGTPAGRVGTAARSPSPGP